MERLKSFKGSAPRGQENPLRAFVGSSFENLFSSFPPERFERDFQRWECFEN
jgi:hypothetical protein